MQWLELTPHSEKILGPVPGLVMGLFSVEFACFPWVGMENLQSKGMHLG